MPQHPSFPTRTLGLLLVVALVLSAPPGLLSAQQIQGPPPPPPAEEPVPEVAPEEVPPAAEEEPAVPEPEKAGAALKGRVLRADRRSPVAGARVHAVRLGGETFSSAPADAKGRYRLGGLPPGTYRLIVSEEDGLFALEGEIGITSAHDFNVDLAVVPAEGASPEVPGVSGSPRGIAYLVQGGKRAGGTTFWKSPGGITLLVVSAGAVAFILSQAGGDDEESAPVSPSAP